MAQAFKPKNTAAEEKALKILRELQNIKKLEPVTAPFSKEVMQEIAKRPPSERNRLASAVQFAQEGGKVARLYTALVEADLPYIPKKRA